LERLEGGDPAKVNALWTRLAELVDRETGAPPNAPPPAAGLGLGSIFQNATASVGKEPWAGMTYSNRLTLICKNCGSPQQKPRDFQCVYCGGPLFRHPGDPSEGK
jgi:hypothetical protein